MLIICPHLNTHAGLPPTHVQKRVKVNIRRREALSIAAFLPVLEVGLEKPSQTCLALRPFFFLPFHRHPREEEEEEKEEEQGHAEHDPSRLG